MKHLILAATAALAAIPAASSAAVSLSLGYIGQQVFPTSLTAFGTQVGGLSGIDYNAATNSYIAISDDRSMVNPARFYSLSMNLTPNSFSGVTFTGVTTLKQANGTPYPINGIDPEAIRFLANGNIMYTSEGDATVFQAPFVREAKLDGSFVRDLNVPAYYLPTAAAGIRNNLAFESLTTTPNGSIVTATENALLQDGTASTTSTGSPSRIIVYNPVTGNPTAEYVYNVAPVVEQPAPGQFTTNGLTDMLAISDTQFIGIERSFSVGAPGTGYTIKLFGIDLAGATNVAGMSTLPGSYTSVQKNLLLDLGTLGIPLDNIEGITFGQTLSNGHRSLILVADNNFATTQFTQFIAFDVAPSVPEPATWAMMIAGFGLIGATMRRGVRTATRAA